MEIPECNQAHLYIASVHDDIAECSQQLQAKQLEIANALKHSEELTIDAATLNVRMKELEFDEELLKQAEDAAVREKVLAEKKLMEVGGYERAVRMLQKALRDSKQELQDTKGAYLVAHESLEMYTGIHVLMLTIRLPLQLVLEDEKVHIMSEEKKLHHELVQLNMILHKSRAATSKLQQEYNAAMKSKRETDEKLERLSLFLQKTIETTAAQSPTKSSQQQKESALLSPSPLPSPSSIRSQLSSWASSSAPESPTKPSPTAS